MRPSTGADGFTLVEAMIALLLSTMVVTLVTSVFLAQNEFYTDAVRRSVLHESVRGATTVASSELRAVSAGGIVAAQGGSIVARAPLVVGAVCATDGTSLFVFFPLEGQGVDASEVSGYAVRQSAEPWRFIQGGRESLAPSSGVEAARKCAATGADTVGAPADFYRLAGIDKGNGVVVGDLVMLYRKVEFKLAPSGLEPASLGFYQGAPGATLVELASGLSARSGFAYQLLRHPSFMDRVQGKGNLDNIRNIRLYLEGVAPAARATRDSLAFDLTVTVPLENAG